MENEAEKCIGVFDSGVGGLTVVRALMEALPTERMIYLGDTARVPYGNRSFSTILRYSQDAVQFLLQKKVKMVLIACNTASAAALSTLEKETPVFVLGAVLPGAQSAVQATKSGAIGVIATLATIRSESYPKAILSLDPQMRVFSLACPLFTPVIEEGWTEKKDPIVRAIVRRYLEKLYEQSKEIDTLVLACTHYPLIEQTIQEVANELWGHSIILVDSAHAMAQSTYTYLEKQNLLNKIPFLRNPKQIQAPSSEQLQCFITDETRFAEVGARFLGFPIPQISCIDL